MLNDCSKHYRVLRIRIVLCGWQGGVKLVSYTRMYTFFQKLDPLQDEGATGTTKN